MCEYGTKFLCLVIENYVKKHKYAYLHCTPDIMDIDGIINRILIQKKVDMPEKKN